MARPTAPPRQLIGRRRLRTNDRVTSMPDALHRLITVYTARRHTVLFYTLLVTLAAGPLLTAFGFSADLLQVLLAFTLLFALFDVPPQGWRVVLMLAAAVAVALRVAPPAVVGPGTATVALMVGSGIALLAAATTVRFAIRAEAVDAEHIYAALSAYMLVGLFFGVLDWTIEMAWPGSLGYPPSGSGGLSLSTAIYFSFVTLATLGYGDVVPKTELTRGVAVLEAVGGQLYIAVMIARLVGAHLQTPGHDGRSGQDRREDTP